MRLGIMGGTFDPIHYGHLLAAERAREHFQLEAVIFIPCGTPPHKSEKGISPREHRYAMTMLATNPHPQFCTSRLEIDRARASYSVDTVEELRAIRGSQAEFYFITGVDAVLELETWKEPDRLLKMCQLVAVTRPGFRVEQLSCRLGQERAKKVILLPALELGVSSTEIRDRVKKGLSIRYLTPDPVCDYIAQHGLYSS